MINKISEIALQFYTFILSNFNATIRNRLQQSEDMCVGSAPAA